MKPVVLMQLAAPCAGEAGAQDRPDALKQHQRPDDPEEDNKAELDDNINLAKFTQERKQCHPDGGPEKTASEQHQPHLDIDVATPKMGENPGYG